MGLGVPSLILVGNCLGHDNRHVDVVYNIKLVLISIEMVLNNSLEYFFLYFVCKIIVILLPRFMYVLQWDQKSIERRLKRIKLLLTLIVDGK